MDLRAMIMGEATRLRIEGDTDTAIELESCASYLRANCENAEDLRYSLEVVRDNAEDALRLLGWTTPHPS